MIARSDDAVRTAIEAAPTPVALLRRTAAERPDHPALICYRTVDDPSPRTVTYGELLAQVEAAIAALCTAGVQPGDGIAVLLPLMAEAAVAWIAATEVGVAFPMNLLFSSEALATQLRLARTRVAIVLGPHPALDIRARVAEAALSVPDLRTVVEVPADGIGATWRDFLASGAASPDAGLVPDRVAALFHTGGTTGAPKLAQLSNRNLAVGAVMTAATICWQPTDRVLAGLPLFHVAGAIDVLLGAIAVGATVIFPSMLGARDPGFARRAWPLVEETRATILGMVPTSFAPVGETPIGGAELKTLRGVVSGGSSLAPHLSSKFEALLRVPVCQVYGMTEASGIVAAQPLNGTFFQNAVGFAPPLSELSVGVPGDGAARGEIYVRGPNVFQGYRTLDGTTGVPDRWIPSGDLGEIGADGQLRLLGRSKDIIIRSGHNIDPLIIEEAAQAHPDVQQAGAVAMPDTYAGELPVLYVAFRPGAATSIEEVADFVAARIAEPPARPKRIFALPELPLTPFGKVARFKLRQAAAELGAREALADLPIDSLNCTDSAAKIITVAWRSSATPDDRDRATETLGRLGLTLGR